ncbi:ATP-binding protein [Kitasatospora purpeofusca]|uniref:ATP-binding protein n=1 Tax=Kitasatospora purpeofusca TaxID=67352 RepID=UPI00365B1F08
MEQDAARRLLGRQRESETLERLLREVRDGRSRVVVLRGEAGIGKSVLLDHVAARVAGMRWSVRRVSRPSRSSRTRACSGSAPRC